MAVEIPDSEFKSNITKLIETVIEKVDGLATEVRTTSYKVDSMEAKFDRVDAKFDSIDAKFDRMDAKIDRMDATVGRVETDLSRLRTDVRTLSGQFNDVGAMAIKDNRRLDTLEQRVGVLEEGVH
jgi:archaellum component FlaC